MTHPDNAASRPSGASFTPGEWKAECVGASSAGPDAVDVYEVTNGHRRIAEFMSEADANLIAAAPDLYDALREFVRLTQAHIGAIPTGFVSTMEEIGRHAIARAEGRHT